MSEGDGALPVALAAVVLLATLTASIIYRARRRRDGTVGVACQQARR